MFKSLLFTTAIAITSLFSNGFSQCNSIDIIDVVTRASLKITGGEACSTYANIDWDFRRSNGTMTIEWGTSTAYGASKDLYSAKPITLPNLEPNTQYFYNIFGTYHGSTYQYTDTALASFTTAASTPANNPPEITSTPTVSCTTGTTTLYTVSATDPDNDQVTFSVIDQPDWMSFTTPVLTLQPVSKSTNASVQIIASDGNGGLDTLSLQVTVTASTSIMTNNSGNHLFSFRAGNSRTVFFTTTGNHPVTISLHTLNGSVVMHQTVPAAGIEASSLPTGISSGIYLVRLSDTNHSQMFTLKLRK